MLKQVSENNAAINAMQEGAAPYYWVNVGVHKYFTLDLSEATEFYMSVGDSLYRSAINGYGGTEILVTEDAPQSYGVEIEFIAKDGIDDSELPENFISRQYPQLEAERVMGNAMSTESLLNAYPIELLDNAHEVIVRLVRSGAGTVEKHVINWDDACSAQH